MLDYESLAAEEGHSQDAYEQVGQPAARGARADLLLPSAFKQRTGDTPVERWLLINKKQRLLASQ